MKHRAPLIGLALCVVLSVAFYFLRWQPLDEEQVALEEETVQLEQRQQQLRLEIAQLEEVEANQVQIRAALARLEEYIPSGPAQPATIRALQESADAAGVEILSVSFGEPTVVEDAPETGEPDTVLAAIPVTVAVDGGYFQAVDFLRRLEVDVTRASLVESVAVNEAEDGFPTLTSTVAGRLFAVVPLAATQLPPASPPPGEDGTDEPAEDDEDSDAPDDSAGTDLAAPATEQDDER